VYAKLQSPEALFLAQNVHHKSFDRRAPAGRAYSASTDSLSRLSVWALRREGRKEPEGGEKEEGRNGKIVKKKGDKG